MAGSDLSPFDGSRRRGLIISGAVTLVSAVSLWFVASNTVGDEFSCAPARSPGEASEAGPEGGDVADDGASALECARTDDGWDPALTTALTAILGAVLGVGAVSIVYELALRRQFGSDLRRFLRMNTAMVRSGLSGVSTARQFDISSRFDSIDELVCLGRSTRWLTASLPGLLRAAERRRISMLIALPNPDDQALMESVAVGLGADPGDLANSIRVFSALAEAEWATAEPSLQKGTRLRVVYTSEAPLYDAIRATGIDAILVSKPLNSAPGDDLLAITFEDGDPTFPSGWLQAAVEPLAGLNDTVNREKR